MQIKKHNNRNEYALSKSGHWVRNFVNHVGKARDINDLMSLEDMQLSLNNEIKNNEKMCQSLDNEDFIHEKIVIIGDGYDLDSSFKILETLPTDVTIFGVNGAFARWNSKRKLNYYIVNNPYNECLYYFPQIIKTWPKCIASVRTNSTFIKSFKGIVYTYKPAISEYYSGVSDDSINLIDDYRNSVCAALGMANKFKVKKLLLLSLLELYEQERPGMERVKDLWIYPQQKTIHSLIDANLYWMKKAKIDIGYMGNGPDYEYATYIDVDSLKRFF